MPEAGPSTVPAKTQNPEARESSDPAATGCSLEGAALEDLISIRNYNTSGSIEHLHRIDDLPLLYSLLAGLTDFEQRLRVLGCLMSRVQLEKVTICESERSISLHGAGRDSISLERIQEAGTARSPGLFGLEDDYARLYANVEMTRIETLLAILQGCSRRLAVACSFDRDALYNYINARLSGIKACCELDRATESLILSIRVCKSFTFKMFLSVYLKIQHAYLTKGFLNIFMNGDIAGLRGGERDCLLLAKARELFKLFKRTSDFQALRRSLRILGGKRSKQFRSARAKIHFYLGDYYSAMEMSRGTLAEYIAVALINARESAGRLQSALGLEPSELCVHPPAGTAAIQPNGLKADSRSHLRLLCCKKSYNTIT